MKRFVFVACLGVMVLAGGPVGAQNSAGDAGDAGASAGGKASAPILSSAELQQLVGPIALYLFGSVAGSPLAGGELAGRNQGGGQHG